ncbi:MAG TPA: tetratricopeptide repeat protein, partial [Thermoanaerobaculia bacterium]
QGLAALYEKNYPVASERLEKALAASEKELTQAQERVGDRAFFLGESLYEQGRYREAVVAFRRAVEVRGEHTETLNRLGLALDGAGNYSEAEAVLNRAARADQHTDLGLGSAIQSNLAQVLYHQGDLSGARRLQEQTVESLRLRLGADHPDTLRAMGNLAEMISDQGDLSKARQLQEQVLESLRCQLGPDHPDTLMVMGNLAVTFSEQGDQLKARQLDEQVLESRRRRLGEEHPDTLRAKSNLAEMLRLQGDLPKARQLDEQVLESQRRQLGPDHPDTLAVMNNLALILDAQGDLAAERILQEEVLKARRRTLGPKHPETSIVEWNLLLTLNSLHDHSGVQELEKSLNWLLHAEVSQLSVQQRKIRQGLSMFQVLEKFNLPAPSKPARPSAEPRPPS